MIRSMISEDELPGVLIFENTGRNTGSARRNGSSVSNFSIRGEMRALYGAYYIFLHIIASTSNSSNHMTRA